MPIPLVNSIASWFLKKRMHQIELFVKYPNEVQNDVLSKLIEIAKNTVIGEKYDFTSIKITRSSLKESLCLVMNNFLIKLN